MNVVDSRRNVPYNYLGERSPKKISSVAWIDGHFKAWYYTVNINRNRRWIASGESIPILYILTGSFSRARTCTLFVGSNDSCTNKLAICLPLCLCCFTPVSNKLIEETKRRLVYNQFSYKISIYVFDLFSFHFMWISSFSSCYDVAIFFLSFLSKHYNIPLLSLSSHYWCIKEFIQ